MFRRPRKEKPGKSGAGFAGRYRLEDTLGEGGMGVVYAAYDEHLQRRVAIKMIRDEGADEALRSRLLREARVAAGVSHPNICQVYEVGEEGGEVYLVLEMLAGESLAERLGRGTVPLAETLDVALGVLAALEALHAREVVHRDLKPSNIFLTPHGVKLLDFGLATPPAGGATDLRLTRTGAVVGTPRYMAPEQWGGGPVGPGCDLFALGAICFEMLAGRPAFDGNTIAEICHAVVQGEPPVLAGGPEIRAVDTLLQRALAKRAQDRYPSATRMAEEVRRARRLVESGEASEVRTLTRLIVLPFRLLRPDPEIDFLSFALADAITMSLSEVDSLIVRSSAAAAKFSGNEPDLARLASEGGVDAVVLGTLLRAGEQVRATAQLVEAPGGRVLTSRTAQVPTGDIFRLQDELVGEILGALSVKLTGPERQAAHRDVPVSPRAYELYLRANQLATNRRHLPEARDFYRACLAEDPRYAPAWARLARVYRVLSKYGPEGDADENRKLARQAFEKAFALNPDLPIAHNLYTYFEVEEQGGAKECMVRLVERARRHGADPELFAGLVLACRMNGLLEASAAADRRARRLDPQIETSVQYTYFFLADYERALLYDNEEVRTVAAISLFRSGREREAIERMREVERAGIPGSEQSYVVAIRASLEGKRDEALEAFLELERARFQDPEGLYMVLPLLARLGETDNAMRLLDRVVDCGFTCIETLRTDPWLESVRARPEFDAMITRAETRRREAELAFHEAGGESLLGLAPATSTGLDATRQVD